MSADGCANYCQNQVAAAAEAAQKAEALRAGELKAAADDKAQLLAKLQAEEARAAAANERVGCHLMACCRK